MPTDGLDVHGFDVDYMHAIRGRIGLTLSNFHSGLHAFDEFLAKFAHDCTLDSTGAERKLSTETGFELILLFSHQLKYKQNAKFPFVSEPFWLSLSVCFH